MDLIFPHHECEIAQAVASQQHQMVRYWMHNNMITIAGKKMGKSYNNFITLEQFFTGDHPLLEQAYTPMTIRFFILQAHYRSTLDFGNEALIASKKRPRPPDGCRATTRPHRTAGRRKARQSLCRRTRNEVLCGDGRRFELAHCHQLSV